MPAITLTNLPEHMRRALEQRAARHGRSPEAEIRDILERALVKDQAPATGLGSRLAEIGRKAGFTDEELTFPRSDAAAGPISFE